MNQFKSYLIGNKKVIAPVIIAAVLLIVLVATAVMVLRSTGQKDVVTDQPVTKDWLKPTSTLTVGQFRYISPCQLIPMKDAKEIFKFTNKTHVYEKNYTMSPIREQVGKTYVEPSCEYQLNGNEGPKYTVESVQFFDEAEAKSLTKNLLGTSAGTKKVLDKFELVVKNASDDAKSVVSRIKQTDQSLIDYDNKTTYDKEKIEIKFAPLEVSSFDKSVTIDSRMVTDDDGGIALRYKYNNGYYNLIYTPAESDKRKKYDQYDDKALAGFADTFGKALNALDKTSNNKLSQSPAPTVLTNEDTYGSTKLLEGCSIFDSASFNALYSGLTENQPLQRFGYNYGAAKPVDSDKVADKIRFSTCTRTYRDIVDFKTSKSMTFTLYTGPDEKTTTAWRAEKSKDDPELNRTNLQTSADSAYVISLKESPEYAIYSFKLGSYVGSISTTDTSSGTVKSADQTATLNAMNTLIANLKRDINEAK